MTQGSEYRRCEQIESHYCHTACLWSTVAVIMYISDHTGTWFQNRKESWLPKPAVTLVIEGTRCPQAELWFPKVKTTEREHSSMKSSHQDPEQSPLPQLLGISRKSRRASRIPPAHPPALFVEVSASPIHPYRQIVIPCPAPINIEMPKIWVWRRRDG